MDRPTSNEALVARRANPTSFWYSRWMASVTVLLLFLVVQSVSFLIPPFQSPDEPAHLARAYLLSKGEIFLGARGGETGGNIDTGLLAYMDSFQEFPFQYDRKLTHTIIHAVKQIRWSGHRQFRGLFNTAVYFPLPYLPQAVAFAIGERMHLTVETTYYLARLFSLAATLALLWAALVLYSTPYLVLALFAIPMTLFQLGSASLDSVTFGTCALTGALFLRACDPQFSFDLREHAAFVLCIISLATSRVVLIPLTLLPAVLYTVRRSYWYIISSMISGCLSLAWIAFVFVSIKGLPPNEFSTLDMAKYYLTHPLVLCTISFDTLTDGDLLISYWTMFIGVLGWVDTPLNFYVYVLFGILLLGLVFISAQWDTTSSISRGRLSLLCASTLSLVFIFVVELLTFTPFNAKVIDGVQGRYFTPILILFGYAALGRKLSPLQVKLSFLTVFLVITLSIVSMVPKLLQRYWIT